MGCPSWFGRPTTPVDDLALLVEVATGTAMKTHGNVVFLSYAQWQDRRRLVS